MAIGYDLKTSDVFVIFKACGSIQEDNSKAVTKIYFYKRLIYKDAIFKLFKIYGFSYGN